MLNDQEIFDRILKYAKEAQIIRQEVDEIWSKGLVSAEKINTLYIRRQTELLNCFKSFLNLFSSKVYWNETGFKDWAKKNSVNGPLSIPDEKADAIDNLLKLLKEFDKDIIAIIGLHQENKHRQWMIDDINTIEATINTNQNLLKNLKAHIK